MQGWIDGVSNEKNWGMLWGLDVDKVRNVACVGDSRGFVHLCDPRSPRLIGQHQLHKKGNKVRCTGHAPEVRRACCQKAAHNGKSPSQLHKQALSAGSAACSASVACQPAGHSTSEKRVTAVQITSVHVNPVDCNLLLTASNDWEVKLCDLRMLHSISNAAGTAAGPKSELTLQELAGKQHNPCVRFHPAMLTRVPAGVQARMCQSMCWPP